MAVTCYIELFRTSSPSSRRDNGLAKKFEWHLTCLGVNIKKYIIFSVQIEKDVKRIDKNGEITKA